MAIEIEKKVYSYHNPDLRTRNFFCLGSAEKGHPAGKGKTVGSHLWYLTMTDDDTIVEDMADTSLKGCIYFEDGECLKGKSACPVAAVVTIKEFTERIRQLKKLKRSDC